VRLEGGLGRPHAPGEDVGEAFAAEGAVQGVDVVGADEVVGSVRGGWAEGGVEEDWLWLWSDWSRRDLRGIG
jgi:hypothetical protein